MYCNKCGAKLNSNDAFCARCGAPIASNKQTATSSASSELNIWQNYQAFGEILLILKATQNEHLFG